MKKHIFRIFFVLILIFSLGLNILLLYNNKIEKDNEIKTKDIVEEKEIKEINYTKDQISRLFKEYLYNSKIANSENIAIFDVTKITYVGYFKSNKNKKLYYIDEKYSCIEGTDCVQSSNTIKTDENHTSYTTFVVSINPISKDDAEFEILDYSIENTTDFQKVKHEEISN